MMNLPFAKTALAAFVFAAASPAFAGLIKVPGQQIPGTGLGNVATLVTVQDNGVGNGNANGNKDPRKNNGLQSGCVTYNPANAAKPLEDCQMGLEGGDNHSGSAGNNTYLLSAIDGLMNAGQLGLVVNVSEGQPGNLALLTDLYISLFNTARGTRMEFAYTGADLQLGDSGGIGQSGLHRFVFDNAQAAMALDFCPTLDACVVGGGVQFGLRSTDATPDTVYVGAFRRAETPGTPGGTPTPVPEPLSLALIGAGLAGMGAVRRRAKQAGR